MSQPAYIALTGGVGGAKLALGLQQVLAPDAISFIVNTADDFEHLGLPICPDIDTLLYTLSGEANTEVGWGRRGETWQFMAALERLGGETWFRLGDRDLAMHIRRRALLQAGETLTQVTAALAQAMGVAHAILPMSDAPVRTRIATQAGELAFQHYFVRDRCEPVVTRIRFDGSETATLPDQIAQRFADPHLAGIIICPSNPFVSVDPILAVPGLRDAMQRSGVPIVAVSPIVAGAAIKGPTAKMMRELNMPNDAVAVAKHYLGLVHGFVLDTQDAALAGPISALGLRTVVTPTVMVTLADRVHVAQQTLQFIKQFQ